MTNARRSGFTLIELLVVIAILGLLAAILLPAILTVMQANWRAKCANNLKVIGDSVTQYATTRGHGSRYPDFSTAAWKSWFEKQGISDDVLCCWARKNGKVDTSQVWAGATPGGDYEIEIGVTYKRIDDIVKNDKVLAKDKDGNHHRTMSDSDTLGWNELFIDGRVEWRAKGPE